MNKNNTCGLTLKTIKEKSLSILGINVGYYLLLFIALSGFWFMVLNIVSKVRPLLDFFVDIAKPMYQATGSLDAYMLSQVFLFKDVLTITITKLVLFAFLFIIAFSFIRGIKDWLLLRRKTSWYLSVIITFAITLFLLSFVVLMMLKTKSPVLYLVFTATFFLVHKYSLLLTQGLLINEDMNKRLLKLLASQICSYIILLVLVAVISVIISLILGSLPLIAAILLIVIGVLLIIIREQYLLTFVTVRLWKKEVK